MKETQKIINIYEVGDIIDISELSAEHIRNKTYKDYLLSSQRCMVIGVRSLVGGTISYRLLTKNGQIGILRDYELVNEKYLGQADISLLGINEEDNDG